jgi:hypothetical protein
LCIAIPVYCEEKKPANEDEDVFSQNAKKAGIIFNVSNILLDVESYQGGIGFKWFFKDTLAYRGSFDFGYSDSSSALHITLGNTLEYHFVLGRVSPYVGAFLNFGYTRYEEEFDSSSWSKVKSIPISAGPVLGVEVSIFQFLTIFAEYRLSFEYNHTTVYQYVDTSESQEKESSFNVSTGLGNDAKIGVVVYFNRISHNNKKATN